MASRKSEVTGLADLARKLSPSAAITALALAFAYFLMTTVTQKLDAHAAETQQMLSVLRQICESTAKSDAAANRCWQVPK